MSEDLKEKTGHTAKLYFDGFKDERPFDLWRSFDKGLAKDLSLFVTGQMYARERIPHKNIFFFIYELRTLFYEYCFRES